MMFFMFSKTIFKNWNKQSLGTICLPYFKTIFCYQKTRRTRKHIFGFQYLFILKNIKNKKKILNLKNKKGFCMLKKNKSFQKKQLINFHLYIKTIRAKFYP